MQAALSFHPVDLMRPGSLDQVIKGAYYSLDEHHKGVQCSKRSIVVAHMLLSACCMSTTNALGQPSCA